MSYDYAKQILKSAIEILNSKGDCKRNVFDAYVSFSRITDSDLPDNLISQLTKIKASLNNMNLPYDERTGRVKKTLDEMSDMECKRIKDEIISFYYQVLSSR